MELAENSHAITTYVYNTIEQFFFITNVCIAADYVSFL